MQVYLQAPGARVDPASFCTPRPALESPECAPCSAPRWAQLDPVGGQQKHTPLKAKSQGFSSALTASGSGQGGRNWTKTFPQGLIDRPTVKPKARRAPLRGLIPGRREEDTRARFPLASPFKQRPVEGRPRAVRQAEKEASLQSSRSPHGCLPTRCLPASQAVPATFNHSTFSNAFRQSGASPSDCPAQWNPAVCSLLSPAGGIDSAQRRPGQRGPCRRLGVSRAAAVAALGKQQVPLGGKAGGFPLCS